MFGCPSDVSRARLSILRNVRFTWAYLALQSHDFPQVHSLLSFIGQFLPLFLQPAGLSAAKETVHIIATRIENRILL
jgi:hypothetical protein